MTTRGARSVFTMLAALTAGWLAGGGGHAAPARGAEGRPDFEDVVRRLDPGLAYVSTREGDREPASRDDGIGAGFVLRPDGFVVTSRHVVSGAHEVFVTLPGRGTLPASIVGTDDVTDVALLRVAARDLVPMPVGDPQALRKGAWVLAGGSPFRLAFSWSAGIVSGLGRSGVGVNPKGYEDFIQTDAATNLGNSGGPLVDADGRVVGVMTAILSRTGKSEGVALATPIDVVVDAVERIQSGDASRPSLGLVVREIEASTRGAVAGLEVTRFHRTSAARDAGLRAGDVVVSVDGVPTPRASDLQRVVWSRARGAAVRVRFLRGGQAFEVEATLR